MSIDQWIAALTGHHQRLWSTNPAGSQVDAWRVEHGTMTTAFHQCVEADPDDAPDWSVIFEYELPMEGGRRPDVIVLVGASLVVLEFKSTAGPSQADIDQAAGYLRDLSDYHAESHGLLGHALLVCGAAPNTFARRFDEVTAVSPDVVFRYLYEAKSPGAVDLVRWLNAPYRPLPSLVDAARRIFRDEPLPHVRKAEAVGIPETVELLGRLVDQCAADGGRMLAFVTGVPGAGKTLVGLRLVYERSETHGRATFLSGNGPLVQVLQDALQSRVFVRDLHAFIKTYALNQRRRVPEEHVIVFDEAQRA
ncbi:MAG: DNA/RNA helicase domain-containing protein, partial [Actinomycetota bacterium]